MHMHSELLFANDVFYAAFVTGDFRAMDAIWAVRHPVSCIHPGAGTLEGREEVMESWAHILTSGDTEGFHCMDARAHVCGETGWITCFEVLGEGALIATNIFVLENGDWKIAHHQAAATKARPEESEAASKAN